MRRKRTSGNVFQHIGFTNDEAALLAENVRLTAEHKAAELLWWDEKGALEDQIEELEKDLDQARAGCYACEPVAIENKRLTADRDEWERLWKKASMGVFALQARVEALEAALQKIRTEPGDARDCRYIAGHALADTEQGG